MGNADKRLLFAVCATIVITIVFVVSMLCLTQMNWA